MKKSRFTAVDGRIKTGWIMWEGDRRILAMGGRAMDEAECILRNQVIPSRPVPAAVDQATKK